MGERNIITIDRSRPFDPVEFPGPEWVWKIDEQDERSLALTEVNLADIRLETALKESDNGRVTGEEKLRRLKAMGCIRLDAGVLRAFWENKDLIPESWKGKLVYFDGTILRNSHDIRCALYVYWYDDEWRWGYYFLGGGRIVRNPSAVLAK